MYMDAVSSLKLPAKINQILRAAIKKRFAINELGRTNAAWNSKKTLGRPKRGTRQTNPPPGLKTHQLSAKHSHNMFNHVIYFPKANSNASVHIRYTGPYCQLIEQRIKVEVQHGLDLCGALGHLCNFIIGRQCSEKAFDWWKFVCHCCSPFFDVITSFSIMFES